jgi:hypothetical protein
MTVGRQPLLPCLVHDINQFMPDYRLPTVATAEERPHPCTDGEIPVDHDRLRYVTRIVAGQQGLYTVLLGAALLLPELGQGWGGEGLWGLLDFLLILAGLWIYLAAYQRWIPKYYRKRFGHVEPRQPSAKQFVIFLGVIILLLFFGQSFAHRIDPVVSSFAERLRLMISDPAHQINLWPSLFWIGLFVINLGRNLRSMERQNLCFLSCGTLAFTSIVLIAVWHPDARQTVLWRAFNAGGIGLSFIALGLYDHITLVRVLPKRIEEGVDE